MKTKAGYLYLFLLALAMTFVFGCEKKPSFVVGMSSAEVNKNLKEGNCNPNVIEMKIEGVDEETRKKLGITDDVKEGDFTACMIFVNGSMTALVFFKDQLIMVPDVLQPPK